MTNVEFEKGVPRKQRPDMRAAPSNEEDPRIRAAKRAEEVRAHRPELDEGLDEFKVPKAPDGWTYEWKRKSTFNKEDFTHQSEMARAGWEGVPISRHPEMNSLGSETTNIELKGMVLMERPTELVEDARAFERRKAQNQISNKAAQLEGKNSPLINDKDGQKTKTLKRGYESMPIPD